MANFMSYDELLFETTDPILGDWNAYSLLEMPNAFIRFETTGPILGDWNCFTPAEVPFYFRFETTDPILGDWNPIYFLTSPVCFSVIWNNWPDFRGLKL